jgi:hypothetical protein
MAQVVEQGSKFNSQHCQKQREERKRKGGGREVVGKGRHLLESLLQWVEEEEVCEGK